MVIERKDAELYLEYPENCENDHLVVKNNYVPLTAFDPYSIMLYEEDKIEGFCRNNHEVWYTKKDDTSKNIQLSELDKIGLNLVFPPCNHLLHTHYT